MAKYIDADCLKAEIERLTKTYQDSIWRTVKGETAKDFRDKLLSVIASLQQEHPEIPKIERAEYYYHKGVCEGFSQGSADSLKILEEFMKRKADPVIVIKQQEQPDFPPFNPDDAMKKLDEKIALVKERGTWKGVDVDKFMDEVRGREPVCEELEKELDEFLKDHVFGKLINRNAGLALARHFAEWQSKQDKETIELAEDHAYLAGAVNEREKMMKEAVECRVDSKIVGHGHMEPGIEIDFFHGEFNVGDKVRVIIIKKDNG